MLVIHSLLKMAFLSVQENANMNKIGYLSKKWQMTCFLVVDKNYTPCQLEPKRKIGGYRKNCLAIAYFIQITGHILL